jgi:hypothetical protein
MDNLHKETLNDKRIIFLNCLLIRLFVCLTTLSVNRNTYIAQSVRTISENEFQVT